MGGVAPSPPRTEGRLRCAGPRIRGGGGEGTAGRGGGGRRGLEGGGAGGPRAPPRAPTRAPAGPSRVDDLQQDLCGPGVVRLAEPEDRLLAELLVLLRLGDADQLIERSGLVALRVHEDQLLFHLLVPHPIV